MKKNKSFTLTLLFLATPLLLSMWLAPLPASALSNPCPSDPQLSITSPSCPENSSSPTSSSSSSGSTDSVDTTPIKGKYQCGDSSYNSYTSIDLGCQGKGNPILDMLFGIIRFLSDGVGIVVVLSLIIAGVQYSAAGGDPNAAQGAIKRIRSSITALLIFIFSYAILNYVLPGAVLR